MSIEIAEGGVIGGFTVYIIPYNLTDNEAEQFKSAFKEAPRYRRPLPKLVQIITFNGSIYLIILDLLISRYEIILVNNPCQGFEMEGGFMQVMCRFLKSTL